MIYGEGSLTSSQCLQMIGDLLDSKQLIQLLNHLSLDRNQKGLFMFLERMESLRDSSVKPTATVIICEGWATGETLRELWTEMRGECLVVVCFSAHNVKVVAPLVRRAFPENPIVIGADNDLWKDAGNTGLKVAEEIAPDIFATVLLPIFPPDTLSQKPTDWNDLFRLSPSNAKAQIASHKTLQPPVVHYLGFYQDSFYLSSSDNPQILAFADLSDTQMLKLQPLSFWRTHYGKLNSKGEMTVDWTQAKSTLMENCRKSGLFELSKLRGRGFWMHKDQVILNTGTKIHICTSPPVMGKQVRDFGPHYIYRQEIANIKDTTLDPKTPMQMLESLKLLSFANPTSPYLLLGWLVQSFLSGATTWRPHVWITGQKGAGKSTILNYVIKPMYESWLHIDADKSTEAGIPSGFEK
jgi:putative DNA primase/helicase